MAEGGSAPDKRGLPTPSHPCSSAGSRSPTATTRTIVRAERARTDRSEEARATIRRVDDDAIDAAWRRVEERWDDEKAHSAFLTLSASADRLAEAGRRYREVRERDPERAEVATAQIDRLLGLAMQNLSALKTERNPRSAKNVMLLVAMGVSGAMIASALWALLRSL